MPEISASELRILRDMGAEIEHEVTRVEGIDCVRKELARIAESCREAANKNDSEIINALYQVSLSLESIKPVDMKPIVLLLSEILQKVSNQKPQGYTFEIERDNRQQIKSIKAFPIEDL